MRRSLMFTALALALSSPLFSSVSSPLLWSKAAMAADMPLLPALPPEEAAKHGDDWKGIQKGLFPLSPTEIEEFRKLLRRDQAAINDRPPPPSTGRVIEIDLQPGHANPVLHLSLGRVTPLSVFDIFGNPWPITVSYVGNKAAFDSQVPEKDGHHLVLTPLSPFAHGNLTIYLKDLSVPIVVDLQEMGDKEFDNALRLRVSRNGPGSPAPAIDGVASDLGDPVMASLAQGITPEGVTEVKADLPGVYAWRKDGALYLRLHGTVLSPSPAAGNGDAQFSVFRIEPALSLVWVSLDGRRQPLHLTLEN